MPEAVLHLPGTPEAEWMIETRVEEDLDETVFEDEELEEDDWEDLDDPDELEFDENGDDWDDEFEEDFEDFVAGDDADHDGMW